MRVRNQRSAMQRSWARELAGHYARIGVEDMALKDMVLTVVPGLRPDTETAGRNRHRSFAAHSHFLDFLKLYGNVQVVDPAYSTQTCRHCRHVNSWGEALAQRCAGCGAVHDVDQNAATILLERLMALPAPAPAPETPQPRAKSRRMQAFDTARGKEQEP